MPTSTPTAVSIQIHDASLVDFGSSAGMIPVAVVLVRLPEPPTPPPSRVVYHFETPDLRLSNAKKGPPAWARPLRETS